MLVIRIVWSSGELLLVTDFLITWAEVIFRSQENSGCQSTMLYYKSGPLHAIDQLSHDGIASQLAERLVLSLSSVIGRFRSLFG